MIELFSEIYGCYYSVVADILRNAGGDGGGIDSLKIDKIVEEKAFSESCFHLIPRLMDGQWDLLREENGRYQSKLTAVDTRRPVSNLEKSWIKALLSDRRIKLFFTEKKLELLSQWLAESEPLFHWNDFHCFDQATDGDSYEDPRYRHHFRQALMAMNQSRTLWVHYSGGKGAQSTMDVLPLQMLYSEKDDKFRILCAESVRSGTVRPVILNVSRVLAVKPSRWNPPEIQFEDFWKEHNEKKQVTFLIGTRRNALERAMLQFASYQKTTTYLEGRDCYLCKLQFDESEEMELLIRLLSFGPLVEVLTPQAMREEMKKRITDQMEIMRAPLVGAD